MPSVVEPIAPAPSTSELPQLDEGDECTEIFGRQTSEALAALRGAAPPAPSTTAVDARGPFERPSASILGVLDESDEVSRELSAQRARASAAEAPPSSGVPTVEVPDAPATRDLQGEPPAALAGEPRPSDDDLDATRADFDLAATRPLPQASAAMAYLPGRPSSEPPQPRPPSEPAAAAPGHGRGGALAGRMTLTPLVPPLPSVSTLAGIGDRASALPPPRPPALSTAAVVMSGGAGSSPPASPAPLPPAARPAPGSSPPASSSSSVVPVMTRAPVVTRPLVGMDFDDATLVKQDDEPPILLQRRKSVPPATPAAVDESGERQSTAANEPEKRGLIGRLLSRVLG